MNIGIAVVLLKAYIGKHKCLQNLEGTSIEIFGQIENMATDSGDDEIVDCLNYIERCEMVEKCFPPTEEVI